MSMDTPQSPCESLQRKLAVLPRQRSSELSMGWVDPRVGLGWVGSGSRIFILVGRVRSCHGSEMAGLIW